MAQLKALCGKAHNSKGLPWKDAWAVKQHQACCPLCAETLMDQASTPDETLGLELTQMIASDEPDGAFFGIAHELGEL